MTLLGGALGMGRAQAESRMTQTWEIGTLMESTDPVTFDVTHVLDVVYDGPGRYRSQTWTTSEPMPGKQLVSVQSEELHLPAGTSGITVDMRAVCTACPEDASLVGKVLRVKGRPSQGQVTSARFPVEDIDEWIEVGS